MRCLLILVGPSHRTAEQRGTRMPPAAPPPPPPVALTPAKHTPANTMDIAQPPSTPDSRCLRPSPKADHCSSVSPHGSIRSQRSEPTKILGTTVCGRQVGREAESPQNRP